MASTYLLKALDAGLTDGNSKTWTWSGWVKRSKLGSDQVLWSWGNAGSSDAYMWINSDDKFTAMADGQYGSSGFVSTMEFKDLNAWYHIVFRCDVTEAANDDRWRVYVNGEQITMASQTIANATSIVNQVTTVNVAIGRRQRAAALGDYWDGYMAQVVVVDGTAYGPSTFGSTDATTGEWKPKSDGEIRSAVTFGTNGGLYPFSNASYLGYDYQSSDRSGTTNDYTLGGSGYKTSDNPSDNQPTLNRQVYKPSGPSYSYSQANQGLSFGGSDWASIPGTIGPGDSGKWYFEAKVASLTNYGQVGFMTAAFANYKGGEGYFGQEAGNIPAYGYGQDGKIYYSTTSANGQSTSADWDTFTGSDICMCALDLDNNFVYFGKNGTWGNSGDPTSGSTGTGGQAVDNPTGSVWLPGVAGYNITWLVNFGNGYFDTTQVASANSDDGGLGTFEYDVPAGYRTICTKNIKTYG